MVRINLWWYNRERCGKMLIVGLCIFLTASNWLGDEYSLVTDKEGRTYKHWKIKEKEYPNGRIEHLANLDKVKKGISADEFIKLVGPPNDKGEIKDLKVYYYKVSMQDWWVSSEDERMANLERGLYSPDYDIMWEPFFFRNDVFIGCGNKIQDEVNNQYKTSYRRVYVRSECAVPEELYELCPN